MPAQLTGFDREIRRSKISVNFRTPGSPPRDVVFQFPPKIVSDGRQGAWKEEAAAANTGDLMALYQGAEPRIMTMEWKYVVGFDSWTIDKVKTELKHLRGYFRNPFDATGQGPLIILLQVWKIGGDAPMSFRMKAVNVKHGPTMVGNSNGDIFPLLTEIAIELKSWPKIGDTEPVETVPGQKTFTPDWF